VTENHITGHFGVASYKILHFIFINKAIILINYYLDDPKFEQSLLDKAQKQQDLVVMSYDSKGTTKVLYEPKTSYKIDRIEVIVVNLIV
jgi:hypothetical protein